MKAKRLTLMILTMLMLSTSLLIVTMVFAPSSWPLLPTTPVHFTAEYGFSSYFISTLSGVPDGFDVYDGIYAGWCVDRSVTMARGVSHDVILYSSISPPVLTDIDWVAINYILNHKLGTRMDIQNAIWHFSDNYTPIGGYSARILD